MFGGEREMEMEEGEEGTELVDGYSKRERGVLNNKWYIENWDRRPAGVGDDV